MFIKSLLSKDMFSIIKGSIKIGEFTINQGINSDLTICKGSESLKCDETELEKILGLFYDVETLNIEP